LCRKNICPFQQEVLARPGHLSVGQERTRPVPGPITSSFSLPLPGLIFTYPMNQADRSSYIFLFQLFLVLGLFVQSSLFPLYRYFDVITATSCPICLVRSSFYLISLKIVCPGSFLLHFFFSYFGWQQETAPFRRLLSDKLNLLRQNGATCKGRPYFGFCQKQRRIYHPHLLWGNEIFGTRSLWSLQH